MHSKIWTLKSTEVEIDDRRCLKKETKSIHMYVEDENFDIIKSLHIANKKQRKSLEKAPQGLIEQDSC